MEWHTEFRAYARAFGSDEVAAILLRNADREWLVWPEQTVEGLTFTLKADSLLSAVPADDLQHVVGWVHSHPLGMSPDPSRTDDDQIRELAIDLAGRIAEMWIFGGHDYGTWSVTKAVLVGNTIFTSDLETWRQPTENTPWDDAAHTFYNACRPPAGILLPDIPNIGEDDFCSWCLKDKDDPVSKLCNDCAWDQDDAQHWQGHTWA